jgi:hypothetical protein
VERIGPCLAVFGGLPTGNGPGLVREAGWFSFSAALRFGLFSVQVAALLVRQSRSEFPGANLRVVLKEVEQTISYFSGSVFLNQTTSSQIRNPSEPHAGRLRANAKAELRARASM